jgi:hypothetical protein
MPEPSPGRLRRKHWRTRREGWASPPLRHDARRVARGLVCAAIVCAVAAPPAAAAEGPGALLLAQADNQPAAAPSASPPPSKPAPKPQRKPAPKPPAAAPAKATRQAEPAPAAAAPPAPPAEPAQAPPPKPPPSAAAEPQPLAHAARAGVKSCLDGIARAANGTIDTEHTAMSQWFTGAADSHMFESIVSLAYPNRVAPRAAAILVAAPTATQNCDTSTVQVFPTARPCNVVEADLLKDGKVIADLAGLPVTQSPNGARQILLPTAGNGCVMIVVTLMFGK